MQAIVALLILLGTYAAGYFTRDYVSRKRRAEARRWKGYAELEWPRPANTNEAAAETPGELGQMLSRWEDRVRARRTR